MARTVAAAIPEATLTFAEFYDAVTSSLELAAYVIRIHENGDFTFEDANEVVERLAGRPLAEIRGRTLLSCLPPDIGQCLTDNTRRCVETARPVTYHRTMALPTGQVSFKTNLTPVIRASASVQFVIGFTRDVTHETILIENAQHHAAMLRTLGIALPSSIYLLDLETKTISFIGGNVNQTRQNWRKQAEAARGGAVDMFFHPDDQARAIQHWADLTDLADGEIATVSYRILSADGRYRRHENREAVFSRNADGKVKLVLGVSEDMSLHDRIEQEVRDLSTRMLTLQIDERRRIAEELHDSTGQHLTAATLALRNARELRASSLNGNANGADLLMSVIDDAAQSLGEAQREIRVLSYLLHPPHLQSQGLAEALRTFASGFGRRAGLKVDVDVGADASLIDDDVAVHLFRVCQEALTNVYRHARAGSATIELEVGEDVVELTVSDDGIGFDAALPERALGVGLPGMRDRMARLGGTVRIIGSERGTVLSARLPTSEALGRSVRPASAPPKVSRPAKAAAPLLK